MCIEIIMLIDNILIIRYTRISCFTDLHKKKICTTKSFRTPYICSFSLSLSLSLVRSLARSLVLSHSRSIHVRFLFATD